MTLESASKSVDVHGISSILQERIRGALVQVQNFTKPHHKGTRKHFRTVSKVAVHSRTDQVLGTTTPKTQHSHSDGIVTFRKKTFSEIFMLTIDVGERKE